MCEMTVPTSRPSSCLSPSSSRQQQTLSPGKLSSSHHLFPYTAAGLSAAVQEKHVHLNTRLQIRRSSLPDVLRQLVSSSSAAHLATKYQNGSMPPEAHTASTPLGSNLKIAGIARLAVRFGRKLAEGSLRIPPEIWASVLRGSDMSDMNGTWALLQG